jgi:long-chain acyl-CoA synthetase
MSGSLRAEQILERSAERWPHRAAIVDQQGSQTFEGLYVASVEVSRTLQDAGARAGSIVGVSVVDARHFLASLFGILRAGCIAIPVAPNLSDAEQARVISETGIAWLVLDSQTGHTRSRATTPHTESTNSICVHNSASLKILRYDLRNESPTLVQFPDAAVIRHTSGTTAKSKGVVLSHRAVRERADASQHLLGVTHDDVILAPLPLSYHFVASALSCVQAGATILDCANLIAPEMLAFGATFGATMIYASPIQYELMARTDSGHPLPKLKRAISTSALLPKRTADSFFERFGVRLTQVYGIIEVGLPLWNELESIESTALGICKPPYEAIVVDERGQRLPTGEIGELAIRGPGLFSGYLLENRSESHKEHTATALDGSWFLTGDLVAKDELGVILYRGRKKSVINCGGNKIFPEEIEEVLRHSPDIKAVRVSAEPHPLLGSLVIAEIVPVQSSNPSIEAWRALCYNQLSGYKVPKEFRIVDSLPSTGSGKIIRYKDGSTTDSV